MGDLQIIGGAVPPISSPISGEQSFAPKYLIAAVALPMTSGFLPRSGGPKARFLHITPYAVSDLYVVHMVFRQIMQQTAP